MPPGKPISNTAQLIKPMLAEETDTPFSDKGWLYEIKWDGYRAIAECSIKQTLLYSRNGISFGNAYPQLYHDLQRIKTSMILDGEIVALNEKGNPSFQQLQYFKTDDTYPLLYYVFDILQYKGKDTTHLPLLERKQLLKKALPASETIRYCDHMEEDGLHFFAAVKKKGMEGMMAKKKDSIYVPGKRTASWLKVKNQHTEEAVIAGFTAPRGSRPYFGALILGIYQNKKLVYAGHTGTGFTEASLEDMYQKLQSLITTTSPFDGPVRVNNKVTWVKPKLVANIRFTEWTKDGAMRHPVFTGLRIDKNAKDMKTSEQHTVTPPASGVKTKKAAPSPTPTKKAGNTKLALTHLDKIYWPDEKITKGDVINYYNSIYKYIIPHLKDRPQSLRRNPNGIKDEGFFQKDLRETAPDWATTIEVHSDSADKDILYFLCNDKISLLYLANLGCIELNPWNSRTAAIDNPDYLILDIDPSDKNTFNDVIDIALVIKGLLDNIGIKGYCKTSGASGMHIHLPLHARYSYEECRHFAELLAHHIIDLSPVATIERSLSKRSNKQVYIDYLQNKKGQTIACPYSLRPKPGATVSAPLDWKEVKPGLDPHQFTIHNMLKRVEKKGDLFQPVLGKGIDIQKALKKL